MTFLSMIQKAIKAGNIDIIPAHPSIPENETGFIFKESLFKGYSDEWKMSLFDERRHKIREMIKKYKKS